MKGKILTFLYEVRESDFDNLYPSLIEEIGFSFFRQNRPSFQGVKLNFLFRVSFY